MQSNVSAVIINVLELSERFDDVDILSRPRDCKLRSFVETVIQDLERFENMAPVFPLVIQALVEHIHNLIKVVGTIEGHLSYFTHLCPSGSPWILLVAVNWDQRGLFRSFESPYHCGL